MINAKKRKSFYYDNSILRVDPTQLQLHYLYDFVQNLPNTHLQNFKQLLQYLRSPLEIKKTIEIITTSQGLESAINKLSEDQYLIVQDYNEYLFSYKGVISCLLLGNSNECYLIDCIELREQLSHQLSKVFEHPKIVKLMYNPQLTLQNLKRDFQIFPFNHFNLSGLQIFHHELTSADSQDRPEYMMSEINKLFEEYLIENQNHILNRPLQDNKDLFNLIKKNYLLLIVYAKKLGQTPTIKDQDVIPEQMKQYYYQEILKQYMGGYAGAGTQIKLENVMSFLQLPYTYEQQQRIMYNNGWQKQLFTHLFQFSQTYDPSLIRQEQLYYTIVDYRNHKAKIIDINPYKLFPDQIIQKIILYVQDRDFSAQEDKVQNTNVCPTSILQLQKIILSHRKLPKNLVDGWSIAKQIYFLIQINDQIQEETHKLNKQIFNHLQVNIGNRSLSHYSIDKYHINIRKLLIDVGWGNSTEWFNAKDDASIKLYKEIISIDQFDYSITQQFIDKLSHEILSMRNISKYLKYAQLMRKKKFTQLEAYYNKVKELQTKRKQGKNSSDEGFSDELVQPDQAFKDQLTLNQKLVTKQTSLSFAENITKNIKSATSLEQGMRSRRSSETSSAKYSELQQSGITRQDIKPLPNDLQQIYELAIQVKKKTAKPPRKKDKKDTKDTNQAVQFIPNWQDIQRILMAQNNLN